MAQFLVVRPLKNLKEVAVLFLIFGVAVLVLIAVLVGFIFVQIKARPVWRLLSIAVVLTGSCWFCSFYVRETTADLYVENYGRGCGEFVDAIDQLAIEGRTNDIHQACQKFQEVCFFSTDMHDLTNFNQFVDDTSSLVSERPRKKLAE